MAKDVAQTLKGMLAKNLNFNEQEAEEYFFRLKVCYDMQGIVSSQTVFQDRLQKSSKSHSRSCGLP